MGATANAGDDDGLAQKSKRTHRAYDNPSIASHLYQRFRSRHVSKYDGYVIYEIRLIAHALYHELELCAIASRNRQCDRRTISGS